MPVLQGVSPTARKFVRIAWAITLACLVAFAGYAILGIGRGSADDFFQNVVNIAGEFAAAAVCISRGVLVRRERIAWLALGAGIAASAGGDLIYAVYLRTLPEVPFPSIGDALWLAFYPLSYVCVMQLLRARVRQFHTSMWLDGAIGGLGVAAITAALIFQPILDTSTGSFEAVAVNLAYPAGDFILLAFIMGICAMTSWRPGRAWVLLGGGLLLDAIADCIYLYQVSKGQYVDGAVLDSLWPACYALMALAAWQPQRDSEAKLDGWAILVAPTLCTFSAIGLFVFDHFHRINTLALVLATVTTAFAVVRTGFTFKEVRALAESRRQALTDDLTGLRNRRFFYQRLGKALEGARTAGRSMALLVIDLDRFKELNDTLGHHAGDLLLQQIGPRLEEAVREADTIARLGGDEFAVLLPCPAGDSERGQAAAERIRAALERPFDLAELSLHVEASIGVALFPDHGSDPEVLLQRADVAMYEAKAQRSGCAVYAPERDQHSRDRLALMGELRTALDTDEIVVFYQPKAELAAGRVTGVEALVRWDHPTRGMLGPYMFLPMAEQTGLMRPLTIYVLRRALKQWGEWRREGFELTVAVNLAVPNLLDDRIVADVRRLLEEFEVPASRLQLEITEDSVMADPVRAVDVLEGLRDLGVSISLDDFGTGYSSLAYLKRLAVDELKIDKSFVMDMTADEEDAVIVRSTIELAKNLSLRVVAEGVETDEAWDALARMGCDVAQGYLLSKPVPPDELPRWLEARGERRSQSTEHSWQDRLLETERQAR